MKCISRLTEKNLSTVRVMGGGGWEVASCPSDRWRVMSGNLAHQLRRQVLSIKPLPEVPKP